MRPQSCPGDPPGAQDFQGRWLSGGRRGADETAGPQDPMVAGLAGRVKELSCFSLRKDVTAEL